MLREDTLSKKIAATISALFLLCFVSACDTRELTSDAFALGKETGTTWRELSTEIEIISSWATDVGETVDIPKVEKEKACQGMWLLVGWPTFGLENMSKNRTDFIDGCMTTIGS
jgi:hypothetical protein